MLARPLSACHHLREDNRLQRHGGVKMASEVKFYLRLEISNLNYPVSMCMLPPMAIYMASEAMMVSKQPQRSHLASELSSVTSITQVTMLIWPLRASSDSIFWRTRRFMIHRRARGGLARLQKLI